MSLQDAAPPAARPYGLLGLVISCLLILVATAIVCLILAAASFAVAVALVGWQPAVDRISDLDTSTGDAALREKLGLVVSLVAYAVLSLAVLLAARLRGRRQWREIIAWRSWNPFRRAGWVWAFALGLVVYSLAADAAITRFAPSFNGIVHLPSGTRWAVLFVLLAAVFAPIGEELLFRGWLYTSLRSSFGIVAAILIVSTLFALAHWESTHLYALAVFPVGLGLAWIRERTGSLLASICVHGAYNGIASVLLFVSK